MAHAYSMEGFELRFEGGVLEMRTDGIRTESMGTDPRRAFESLLKNAAVRAVLFDIRGAQYDIHGPALEERARIIGRLCRDFPIALVARPDQDGLAGIFCEMHARQGGDSRICRSRNAARDWLQGAKARLDS